ncbi:MAG: hypothetical protein ACJASQ_003938 [Crocinitomicaceae bacterium]|jgi:hypothetical protein
MKKLATLSIAIIAIALLSVSCNKGCDLDTDDMSTGAVIATNPNNADQLVVIYPSAGQMTGSMGGDYHINGTDSYASNFEVSFDGGQSKAPVNYGAYSILANPVVIGCDAWVERNVVFDDINFIVTYTVTVHECNNGCDESRTLENYVLIPSVPSNYFVNYVIVNA